MKWYERDLWRCHLSWLTFDWVGETREGWSDFDAKGIMDKVESCGFRSVVVYSKFHDGFCVFPSRYTEPKPPHDFLGECREEARRRGIRFLIYYSSSLDVKMAVAHEKWRVRLRDGSMPKEWFNSRFAPVVYLCFNNPEVRATLVGQLGELLAYEPHGLWLDIFSPHECWCDECRSRYAREHGGADLFDEDLGGVRAFYRHCYSEFLKELKTFVKSRDPECLLLMNGGMKSRTEDDSVDFYQREADGAAAQSTISANLLGTGRPFEITCRLEQGGYRFFVKPRDAMVCEMATILANGGAASLEFSPMQTSRFRENTVRIAREVGEYIRAREENFIGAKPLKDAVYMIRDQDEFSLGHNAWNAVMNQRDIPYVFSYHNTDLARYPLAVVDPKTGLTEAQAEALREYVREGGNLVVERECSVPGSRTRALLEEVLGIRIGQRTRDQVNHLDGFVPELARKLDGSFVSVPDEAYTVEAVTARPLAFYRYAVDQPVFAKLTWGYIAASRDLSSDPAITVNEYGKGKAVFVACPLVSAGVEPFRAPGSYERRPTAVQLAVNVLRYLLPEPLFDETTPAGVELQISEQGGRHIVNVMNRYLDGEYMDAQDGLLRLANVRIAVNANRIGTVNRVSWLGSEAKPEPLPFERDGKWIVFELPAVGPHEMVILE